MKKLSKRNEQLIENPSNSVPEYIANLVNMLSIKKRCSEKKKDHLEKKGHMNDNEK